jgi:hypothetical protein
MKIVDRVFGWLLVVSGILHGFGSWNAFRNDQMSLLWALSGSFAVILLAAINLLRAERTSDRGLASLSFAGCLVWICFVIWFGRLIGNVFDFRPLAHLVVTMVLAIFSMRAILGRASISKQSTRTPEA